MAYWGCYWAPYFPSTGDWQWGWNKDTLQKDSSALARARHVGCDL